MPIALLTPDRQNAVQHAFLEERNFVCATNGTPAWRRTVAEQVERTVRAGDPTLRDSDPLLAYNRDEASIEELESMLLAERLLQYCTAGEAA